MPKCYMLIGVPGSGKSTWLNSIIMEEDALIISTDNYIEKIAASWGTTYDAIFKDVIKVAEKSMWTDLGLASICKCTIYVDRTNLTRKSRAKIMSKLPGYEFIAIVFSCPEEEEWQRRISSREGKHIPANALGRMRDSYQAPTYEEGFKLIYD